MIKKNIYILSQGILLVTINNFQLFVLALFTELTKNKHSPFGNISVGPIFQDSFTILLIIFHLLVK